MSSERLDAETLERRLHLWFFRDLSEEQRLGLFKLSGYPVDEMGQHSIQQMALRKITQSLRATPSSGEGVELLRDLMSRHEVGETIKASDIVTAAKGKLTAKEAYNGLTYLARIGSLERVGYGLYRIRSALSQQPVASPVGEAVAWVFELARSMHRDTGEYTDWAPPQLSFTEPCVPEKAIRNLRPLYASPVMEDVTVTDVVCAFPKCTCAVKCDEQTPPTLEAAYETALVAVETFYDAASHEETQWTGWGEQTVPASAEMRRVKAKQALAALRDADTNMRAALSPQEQKGGA